MDKRINALWSESHHVIRQRPEMEDGIRTPCLEGRKRHYFGRRSDTAGGMGNPPGKECLWCGKRIEGKKMKKPKDADYYGWKDFIKWAERNGVNLEAKPDWEVWWECWRAGYISAMNL